MAAEVTGSKVRFTYTVENPGNVRLSGLSLRNDLDGVLGAGNYRVVTPPRLVEDPGTVLLNGNFTGSGSQTDLILVRDQ